MTGRLLAYAALWANGVSRVLCAEIMGVTEQGVMEARKRLQQKYAAEGVTIRNGADMARVLDAELPTITRHHPSKAMHPDLARRGGRPSTITPERLTAVLQLRAEGMSLASYRRRARRRSRRYLARPAPREAAALMTGAAWRAAELCGR